MDYDESRGAAHRARLMDPIVNYKSFEKIWRSLQLAPGHFVGDDYKCFIIAEVGQNHQGDLNIARGLIDVAAECGANCVKFQKCDLRSRFNTAALNQPYLGENSFGETYGQHRAHLEFTEEEFIHLRDYAVEAGLVFAATGMDKKSIDFLYQLDVPFFKIGSADCANYPLLTHVARYKRPLVISTGMHDLTTISKMYSYLHPMNTNIALMQCTSAYPTPPKDVNLSVMETYKTRFPFAVVGYSGHETGIGISIAAVALGARILERHITFSHALPGTDHIASLEPLEFKQMVEEIRKVELAIGSSEKFVQESEALCKKKLGKTVVSTRYLPADSTIDDDMIDLKVALPRGFESQNAIDLIGRKLRNSIPEDCSILPSDLY